MTKVLNIECNSCGVGEIREVDHEEIMVETVQYTLSAEDEEYHFCDFSCLTAWLSAGCNSKKQVEIDGRGK